MEKSENTNPLFQKEQDLIGRVKSSGQPFIFDSEDEITDEYAHFYFLGVHEGREVLFDTVLYTYMVKRSMMMK